MAVLAAIRDQLPDGGAAATPTTEAVAEAPAPQDEAKATPAKAKATPTKGHKAEAPKSPADILATLRRLEERAAQARRAAEAKKAEADRLRQRLGELARERDQLRQAIRRAHALGAWAGKEACALVEQAQARLSAIEQEMDTLRTRLQELEADEGVRLLEAEEAARAEAERAKARAERARQLAREGKLAEALASLPARPEEGSPLAQARQELLRTAHRAVEGAVFRAREALAAGAPERALDEIRGVADLLPHVQGEDRRAMQGIFCQAAHRLVPAGQPLVLIRGRRVARRGRLIWTAPAGAIAVGTPTKGGARVLYNLGTPWAEGEFVRAEEADIQPLRARHGGQGQQDNAR